MKFETLPTKDCLYDKCENMEQLYDNFYTTLLIEFKQLQQENVILRIQVSAREEEYFKLEKQLNYLRSGEYFNQLRFERDLLQNIIDNKEISKEDKEFIDMTHKNNELLKKIEAFENQQKEFVKYLVEESKKKYRDNGLRNNFCVEVLAKYKEIIGGENEL